MGYTYTPDNPREIDRVRFLIQDTRFIEPSPGAPLRGIFSDEEIEMVLAIQNGDLNATAAEMARGLAMSSARMSMRVRLGGGANTGSAEIDRSQLSRWYLELADRLDKKSSETPAVALVDWQDGNQEYLDAQTGFDDFDFEGSE